MINNYLTATTLLVILTGCGTETSTSPTTTAPQISQQDSIGELTLTKSTTTHSQDAYARFEFSANNATGYHCSLNGHVTLNCTSPFFAFPLEVGEHSFTVEALGSTNQVLRTQTLTWQTHSIFGDGDTIAAHNDLVATTMQPSPVSPNSWKGILRLNCDFSHASYDDPIVYFGQNDRAHLHRFYGNTLTDEHTDIESLFTTGESSCQGNTLNRSAYWVPTLLAPQFDPSTQQPLYNSEGEQLWQVVPAVVGGDDEAHEVFYYSAAVSDLASIQPIPLGLKIIAGDHMGQPSMPQDTSIVRWHCQSWESDEANNPRWSTSIPNCKAPDRVRMDIFFPSCWNGVDLDSVDHKSHLAYPQPGTLPNQTICPASHPVPIVRVSYHYAFGVKPDVFDPTTQSSKGWRLASDMYDTNQSAGGMSLHADWFNGWHPEALNAILENCIKTGLDCHDGNLANGYRLTGTRPGTQVEPPIINGGAGN